MAKMWGRSKGDIAREQRKICSASESGSIDREIKKKNTTL